MVLKINLRWFKLHEIKEIASYQFRLTFSLPKDLDAITVNCGQEENMN